MPLLTPETVDALLPDMRSHLVAGKKVWIHVFYEKYRKHRLAYDYSVGLREYEGPLDLNDLLAQRSLTRMEAHVRALLWVHLRQRGPMLVVTLADREEETTKELLKEAVRDCPELRERIALGRTRRQRRRTRTDG